MFLWKRFWEAPVYMDRDTCLSPCIHSTWQESFVNESESYLSLREWCLHVLQQTGQILFTVTHHQKQTEPETEKKQVKSSVFPKDNSQHQPHSPGSIDMCICEHVLPLQLGANHNFLQLHNVGMPQPQQQVNLS